MQCIFIQIEQLFFSFGSNLEFWLHFLNRRGIGKAKQDFSRKPLALLERLVKHGQMFAVLKKTGGRHTASRLLPCPSRFPCTLH